MLSEITVTTAKTCQFVDITDRIAQIVAHSSVVEGTCHLFVPHTTAAITLNENWDPDVQHDILSALAQVVPDRGAYRHAEGNSAAHVKALLTGHSTVVPVSSSRLLLGRWQGIYLAEYDGPRQRRVVVQIHPAPPGIHNTSSP